MAGRTAACLRQQKNYSLRQNVLNIANISCANPIEMWVSLYIAFSFTLLIIIFGQVLSERYWHCRHKIFSFLFPQRSRHWFPLPSIFCDDALFNFLWWNYVRKLLKITQFVCFFEKQASNFHFLDIDIRISVTHVWSFPFVFRPWLVFSLVYFWMHFSSNLKPLFIRQYIYHITFSSVQIN